MGWGAEGVLALAPKAVKQLRSGVETKGKPMAKVELSEETKAGIEEVREADLLIAVAVPVDTEQLRAVATQAILGTGQSISGLRTVVTFPGQAGVEAPIQPKTD